MRYEQDYDGRPTTTSEFWEDDPLLAALKREHGDNGRPDLVDIAGFRAKQRK
jgi:hypothetical protein